MVYGLLEIYIWSQNYAIPSWENTWCIQGSMSREKILLWFQQTDRKEHRRKYISKGFTGALNSRLRSLHFILHGLILQIRSQYHLLQNPLGSTLKFWLLGPILDLLNRNLYFYLGERGLRNMHFLQVSKWFWCTQKVCYKQKGIWKILEQSNDVASVGLQK